MQQVFSAPRPLTHTLRIVMKPAFRHRSFTEASILLDWHKIINQDLAQRCYPERLVFPRGRRDGGVLIIAVDSSSSLLIQHSTELLINWINAYFGYQAVNAIKLNHTLIPKPRVEQKPQAKPLPTVESISSSQEFDDIEDLELKQALTQFKQSYDSYCAQQHLKSKS